MTRGGKPQFSLVQSEWSDGFSLRFGVEVDSSQCGDHDELKTIVVDSRLGSGWIAPRMISFSANLADGTSLGSQASVGHVVFQPEEKTF